MRLALAREDRPLLLAAAAYAFAVLLNADHSPLWCSLAAALALGWRAAAGLQWARLPPWPLRIALTLTLVAFTLSAFHTLNGLQAGSALLVAMGAVKWLETRTRRDALAVVGVTLFLLLAACLDRQSLLRAPLYALGAWLGCAALAALGMQPYPGARVALRRAGIALLLALPLALVAFVLVPRLSGPLWAQPEDTRATTGLAEDMSPGSISELSISDAVAFRVRFADATPPPAQRYWRGPVLHDFDGYTWRVHPAPGAPTQAVAPLGPPVRYRVTLEPSSRPWWFSLDTISASPSPRVFLTYDGQLIASQPVTQPLTYEAVSTLQVRSIAPLPPSLRALDTRYPSARNPRSQDLARRLREASSDDADFARRVLEYLRNGGFSYTLTPPQLDLDSVDDLLFRTHEGFCGHYASAYAMVLRAGGVPARVVTGYLGGTWNSIGGYLTVRQADAHAWTEIWLEGRGWVRVDPTAVVAPERLQRGLRDLLPFTASAMAALVGRSAVLAAFAQAWDAGNQWWQEQVIGYTIRSQLSLLRHLGLPDADYTTLVVLLTLAAAACTGLLLWQLPRTRARARPDRLARAWGALRLALQEAGCVGLQQAGPLVVAAAGSRVLPSLQVPLQQSAQHYARLRYGNAAEPHDVLLRRLAILTRLVREHAREGKRNLGLLPPQLLTEACNQRRLLVNMPEALRQRVGALARRFLRQVPIVGCAGLAVTPLMRAVIALQACLLVAARGMTAYRGLRCVLLYPTEFLAPQSQVDESGVVSEGIDALSGQAIAADTIILSWRDVLDEGTASQPYNVVLHEFAHLLDHLHEGSLSHRPDAGASASASAWHDTLERERLALLAQTQAGEDALIDAYGAEDPAEFFAVCTEAFFERPERFKAMHAALHEQLCRYYAMDPAGWDSAPPP